MRVKKFGMEHIVLGEKNTEEELSQNSHGSDPGLHSLLSWKTKNTLPCSCGDHIWLVLTWWSSDCLHLNSSPQQLWDQQLLQGGNNNPFGHLATRILSPKGEGVGRRRWLMAKTDWSQSVLAAADHKAAQPRELAWHTLTVHIRYLERKKNRQTEAGT